MKYFYVCLLVIFMAFAMNVKAQILDGIVVHNLTVTNVNDDDHYLYNYLDAGMTEIPVPLHVVVEVKPDENFEEFSFKMIDEGGNIVAEGGSLTSSNVKSFEIILPSNQIITWNVYDTYGDGLSANVGTYIKLRNATTNEELIHIAGNSYENIHTELISTRIVAIEENKSLNVTVFPNPVKDILTIAISENSEITSIEIMNACGKKMMDIPFNGSKRQEVSVSDLSSGMYFLNFVGKKRNTIKRVVVQ